MNKRSFGALFGPYLPVEYGTSALAGGLVENMDMDHTTRRMDAVVRFSAPILPEELFGAEQALARALGIAGVGLHPLYPADTFTAEVCPWVITHLKRENVAVNGVFDDAGYRLEEDELYVSLSHGGVNILSATGADKQLQALIYRQYDRRVNIHFDGEEAATKDERYQKMMEQAEQEAAQRAKE